MTTFGFFAEIKFHECPFMIKKIQLILVTYAVNIVLDLCKKWKRTLEIEFKGILIEQKSKRKRIIFWH